MKYIKVSILFPLFAFLFLYSCGADDEPVDPALLVPTPALCIVPAFFNVSAFINGNTVRIEWDKTSGNEWEIQYGTDGFVLGSGTSVDFVATSSLITGLTASVNYDFYIRTKCDDGDYSVWIGPVAPGTQLQACSSPTNLSAIRSLTDDSKVTVAWVANGDENSFQIQYGNTGFTLGSGTIVAAPTSPKTISNLLGNVSYDFYVRSNCAANQNSAWVGPIVVIAN